MNICDLIERSVERWSDKAAVIDRHGEISYRDLAVEIASLGKRLADNGVRPGHGVGLMARNGREFIIAAFAIAACGGVILPVHHRTKRPELDVMLATGVHAIIDDLGDARPLDSPFLKIEVPSAGPLMLTYTGAPKTERFAGFVEEPAFVRFTSGTTGQSKGAIISHRGIMERISAANAGLKVSADDTVICVLPMSFHFIVSTILYLSNGATIVICPDYFAKTMLELASAHSATFLYASPMHFGLLAADESGMGFGTLRRAVSTSAGLPVDVSRGFYSHYGLPISQAYGIIEVGLPMVNTDRPLEKPESVGRSVAGYEVAVFDDSMRILPSGQAGQLGLRGPGMFSGYIEPRAVAGEILRDGWFLTGDEALVDSDGYVTIAGRTKSMINVAGNKVFPDEVESILNRHPDVAVSRVSARPHRRTGEAVHAEVVAKDPAVAFDVEGLLEFCRANLAGYKVPQSIAIVDCINETLSGKIRRGG